MFCWVYRPQFFIRTADVTGSVKLPEGTEMVMPGDTVSLTIDVSFARAPFVACHSGTLVLTSLHAGFGPHREKEGRDACFARRPCTDRRLEESLFRCECFARPRPGVLSEVTPVPLLCVRV